MHSASSFKSINKSEYMTEIKLIITYYQPPTLGLRWDAEKQQLKAITHK